MPGNKVRFAAAFGVIGAFSSGFLASARAQDANHFVLHVINDGADAYVTLLDQNAGSATILQNVRINHQERKDVLVTKDGKGNGSVSWTAKTASGDKQQCGSGNKSSFGVGTEVTVSVNRGC